MPISMRINFLLPHLKISGGVRINLMYAHFLAKRGHDVRVLVENPSGLRRFFANVFSGKPFWMKNFLGKVKRVSSFSEEKNIPAGDIIIATAWRTVFPVHAYSQEKGVKFHFPQHDERLYHGRKEEVDRAYRLPFKRMVVSTWLKEMFKEEYGQDAELLLNTVDRDLFHPVEARRDDSSIRILLLHHEFAWKGTKEGVETVGNLKERFSKVKLILFGAREKSIGYPCDEYYYNLPQEKLAWL